MAKDDKGIASGIVDSSGLTDADWAEINKLRRAFESGGQAAVSKAMADLNKADPIRYLTILDAYSPGLAANLIRDEMAELGMTDDDLRELIRKLEGSPGQKH